MLGLVPGRFQDPPVIRQVNATWVMDREIPGSPAGHSYYRVARLNGFSAATGEVMVALKCRQNCYFPLLT